MPISTEPAPSACNEADAAQDKGAHQDFAKLGRADDQRADVCGVERQRGAAFRPGAPEASVPRPDNSLISPVNWPAPRRAISASSAEAIAPHDNDLAFQHEPGRMRGVRRH